MQHKTSALNGDFGVMIDGVSRRDLKDASFQREACDLWTCQGGLLAVRGSDLAAIAPEELVTWSEVFGSVEYQGMTGREDKSVKGFPILRIGNIRDMQNPRTVAQTIHTPWEQLLMDAGAQATEGVAS